jgi:hypothetical protein
MSFADSLAPYSASVIVAALSCPRQTAYAWKDGSRQPPQWQQDIFLAAIARVPKAKEIKKHNKPAHTIPPRPVAKRKGS